MSRLFSVLAAFLLMLTSIPLANMSDVSAARLQGDAALGEPISVPGTDGGELALVTVTSIQDPFEEYDPAYPPIRGYHFVLLDLTVEVTGAGSLQVDPSKILIRDTEGFLYGDDTIYRPAESTAVNLEYQELSSGSKVNGVIGFQILNGVTIADILLIPDSGQLVQLAVFGAVAKPVTGDEVPWIGYEGKEIGVVTVSELIDPFQDYDSNYPPDRGSRYVMLTVTVENTGPRPIQTNSANFFLQDADGFLYGPQTIYQPSESEKPELEYGDLAPGDTATGSVGFVVLEGVDLVRVLYQPVGDRLLTLVDFSAEGSTAEPTAKATAKPGPGDAAVDCDEVGPWLTHAHTEASAVNSIVGTLMVMRIEDDPDYVSLAHQVADAFAKSADDLTSLPVPPSVEELNQQLADAFAAYGEATEQLATAVESGDQDAIDEAGQAVYDAEPALITAVGAVGELAATCGIEVNS